MRGCTKAYGAREIGRGIERERRIGLKKREGGRTNLTVQATWISNGLWSKVFGDETERKRDAPELRLHSRQKRTLHRAGDIGLACLTVVRVALTIIKGRRTGVRLLLAGKFAEKSPEIVTGIRVQ